MPAPVNPAVIGVIADNRAGSDAARKAAAYYYGDLESAHPGTVGDLPDDVRAAGRELVRWRESAVDEGRSAYTVWDQTRRAR